VLLTHSGGPNGELHRDPRRSAFLERLRTAGASVLTLAADCADRQQMETALGRAEDQFGAINGVIHAAAVTRTSSISTPFTELDEAACREQFRAKVHGAIILRELLGHPRRPDFVLLMSSLASVLGGLGFSAYAAANRGLDAAAHAWTNESATRWVAVNWDGWELPESRRRMHSPRSRLLTVEEGLSALAKILAHTGPAQVLVLASDLATRRQQWIMNDDRPIGAEQHLSTLVPTSRDAIKDKLAAFFKALFGVATVSYDQSFADLGGDSLMALTLVSRINQAFALRLHVADLLDWQTIDRIAAEIREIKRSATLPRLCRAEEREHYPLSFAQQSMLARRNLVYDTCITRSQTEFQLIS
jgi:acyl carrier protein